MRLTSVNGRRPHTGARMLAVLAAVSVAGCASASVHDASLTVARSERIASVTRLAGSFLTVTSTFNVERPAGPATFKLVRYGVATLQVRSARTGRVIETLLHSLGNIDAVPAPDGSVLAVVNLGCRSQVLRIDPLTGHVAFVRVLPGSAMQAAVSPDGRDLAYLTYSANQPQPCAPSRQPAKPIQQEISPGGGPGPVVNVLAITNLYSGATVRASTGYTYNSLGGPTWSPDGSRVAVIYGQHSIEEVSAAHPEFTLPPPIRAAKGCWFGSAAWTVAGVVAMSGCGGPSTGMPQKLVRLSTAGRQTGSWQLPDCLDGGQVYADPAGRHVLVEVDIGYGNFPPCGDPNHPGGRTIRVSQVRGNHLAAVAVYPDSSDQVFAVTGW